MIFFFIRDTRHKYRWFSSEPLEEIQVKFSRWRKIWKLAKNKLMLLPKRSLSQEQAFDQATRLAREDRVRICHSSGTTEKKTKTRLYFFLQKQRTIHILFLVGETLLLPPAGLATLIPGPNVFFGALALVMITHWRALRGINSLLAREHEFIGCPLLAEWERAVDSRAETEFHVLLGRMEQEYGLQGLHKILAK
jgi:hypothetical protein